MKQRETTILSLLLSLVTLLALLPVMGGTAYAAEAVTVTWNDSDIAGSGNSFTKDGVTVTAGAIDFDNKNFTGGGTFTTERGSFTAIQVADGSGVPAFSWTGNASSVPFSREIMGMGMGGLRFVFTIETPETASDSEAEDEAASTESLDSISLSRSTSALTMNIRPLAATAVPTDGSDAGSGDVYFVGYAMGAESGDYSVGNNTGSGMFDSNGGTKACIGFNGSYSVEFSYASEIIPHNYYFRTGGDTSDFTARNPSAWKLEGKNTDNTWTVLDDKSGQSFTTENNTEVKFAISNTKAYNTFRLTITDIDNGGYDPWRVGGKPTFQLSEVYMSGVKQNVPVTGVTLNKASTTLTVGGTDTLIATVSPSNATNRSVSWESNNERVATVDSTGKITGVAPGTATITVTTADGSKPATCAVTVHAHSFSFTASGASVTAKCTSGCPEGYDTNGIILTLSASNATYTGSAYTGASLDTAAWTAEGLTAPTVEYAGRGNTSYTKSTSAPTDAGDYTASVTVGDATAGVDFTVGKADPSYTAPTGLTATYGDTLAAVALPDGWAWADSTASVGSAGTNTFKVTFTPADTVNYNTVSNIDVSVAVGKAAITITADDKIGKYGDALAELTYTISGAYKAGDDLGVTLTSTATPSSDVGEYPIAVGWNENANYTATLINGKYTVVQTVLAVTFEVNGGSAVAAQSVVRGGTVVRPDDPTKAGNAFDGWYEDATFSVAFDFTKAIDRDMTLYAKWTPNDYNLTSITGTSTDISHIWTKDSNVSVVVTVKLATESDNSFAHYVRTEIDGVPVAATAREGSTVVTLAPAELQRLSVGAHTVSIVFDNGRVDTRLTVRRPSSTPSTGDESHAALWATILAVSALGMAMVVGKTKKRRTAKR